MTEITWHIIIGGALILLGTGLTAIAAIGLTRFPDLLSRMHAATKPQVLGLMLMMTGLAIVTWDPVVAWTVVLVVAFQLVTAPISAHMVGRSAYRTGRVREQEVEVDEYLEDLVSAVHAKQKAERRAAREREEASGTESH